MADDNNNRGRAGGKRLTNAQKDLLNEKQKEQRLNEQLISDMEELVDLGGQLNTHQQKKLKTLKDENLFKTTTLSLEKKLSKEALGLNTKKAKLASLAKTQIESLKESKKTTGMTEASFTKQVSLVEQLKSGMSSVEDVQHAIADLGEDATESMKEYLNIQLKNARTMSLSESAVGGLDDLTGGMASKAKDAFTKFKGMGAAAGTAAAGIAAIVMILISFSGKMDAIGEKFGAIGIHSGAIRTDLLDAEIEATKLGKSLEDVMESVTTLTSEFGTGFAEARSMATSVIDTSVALGLSVSEGGQLVGTFATLTGLSNEAAVALAKQTTLLATASDVAPQQVLRDIASSSEAVAKFTDASGENIARGAIQARKLGIDLGTAASAAESMLDFQSAIENAMTASVMTGRQINIQKLQELSLAGDLEGVAKEQRRLLGDQSDFLSMNVFQRKALAESLGLTVDQAAKMLDHQEEAITLAGQLAGQPGFDDLVGEKGISTLTQLTGSLKSLGATLTNSLGPVLNLVMYLLVGIGKVLEFILEPINMILRGLNVDIGSAFAVPTAHEGGITKGGGLVNTKANEALIPIEKLSSMMADAMNPVVSAINTLNERFEKEYVPALALSNESGGKKAGREIGRQFQMNTA